MSLSITDSFTPIYESKDIDALFPLLESIDEGQKDELKTLLTEKEETNKYPNFSYRRASILSLAGLCCCKTLTEYWPFYNWRDNHEQVKRVFEFHIPEWFEAYFKNLIKKNGQIMWGMDYIWMMDLQARGIVKLERNIIMRVLHESIFKGIELNTVTYVNHRQENERLLKYPETLKEHIWWLFEEETNIHRTSKSEKRPDGSFNRLTWQNAFLWLIEHKHINKIKLLKACLSTANMNFTKPLTGWFADLFNDLQPSPEEILELQNDMMAVFNGPQTKPHNMVLKHFKKLCTEKDFDTDGFIANAEVLLSSETKGIINSCLMVLDKIAAKQPSKQSEICKISAQALLMKDSGIQSKVAKLILKYCPDGSAEVTEAISPYADELLTETKEMLSAYLEETTEDTALEETSITTEKADILSDENKIEVPQTVEDLMFFASQAFENHHPADFDILAHSLLTLTPKLTKETISQFEPALQRASKFARNAPSPLTNLLAIFFIDYCKYIIEQFPGSSTKLKKLLDKNKKAQQKDRDRGWNKNWLVSLSEWKDPYDSSIYFLMREKLIRVLDLIKSKQSLPLLSTPTHHQFWLSPSVLIDRLLAWQKAELQADQIEIQIALARVYLTDAESHIERIENELEGEIKDILLFLFNKDAKPQGPFTRPEHWWTAGITKSPDSVYPEFQDFEYAQIPRRKFTDNYSWKIHIKHEQRKAGPYEESKNGTIEYTVKKLSLTTISTEERVKVLDQKAGWHEKGRGFMLYENIEFHGYPEERSYSLYDYVSLYPADILRFISLVPNHLQSMLSIIINNCMSSSFDYEENEKQISSATINTMLDYPYPLDELATLFVAGNLMSSDKTVRSLAAEIWINGIAKGLINNALLGEMIGSFLYVSFYPLKRLTDIITDNMAGISQNHNRQLQVMIEHAFSKMNDEPIKGQKKLLEVYYELQVKNKQKPSIDISAKLKEWKKTKSLQKVIKQLE